MYGPGAYLDDAHLARLGCADGDIAHSFSILTFRCDVIREYRYQSVDLSPTSRYILSHCESYNAIR